MNPNDELLDKIIESEKELIEEDEPLNFDYDDKNIIVKMEKGFHRTCVILESVGYKNPEEFSVMKFYEVLEFLEKKNEPKN